MKLLILAVNTTCATQTQERNAARTVSCTDTRACATGGPEDAGGNLDESVFVCLGLQGG